MLYENILRNSSKGDGDLKDFFVNLEKTAKEFNPINNAPKKCNSRKLLHRNNQKANSSQNHSIQNINNSNNKLLIDFKNDISMFDFSNKFNSSKFLINSFLTNKKKKRKFRKFRLKNILGTKLKEKQQMNRR